jgi:hypothetical protein
MRPIVFAMRRPMTALVWVVVVFYGGLPALEKMRVDIFPP